MTYNRRTDDEVFDEILGNASLKGRGPYMQIDREGVLNFYAENDVYVAKSTSPDAQGALDIAFENKALTRGKYEQFSNALFEFREAGKIRQFSEGLRVQDGQLESAIKLNADLASKFAKAA